MEAGDGDDDENVRTPARSEAQTDKCSENSACMFVFLDQSTSVHLADASPIPPRALCLPSGLSGNIAGADFPSLAPVLPHTPPMLLLAPPALRPLLIPICLLLYTFDTIHLRRSPPPPPTPAHLSIIMIPKLRPHQGAKAKGATRREMPQLSRTPPKPPLSDSESPMLRGAGLMLQSRAQNTEANNSSPSPSYLPACRVHDDALSLMISGR